MLIDERVDGGGHFEFVALELPLSDMCRLYFMVRMYALGFIMYLIIFNYLEFTFMLGLGFSGVRQT